MVKNINIIFKNKKFDHFLNSCFSILLRHYLLNKLRIKYGYVYNVTISNTILENEKVSIASMFVLDEYVDNVVDIIDSIESWDVIFCDNWENIFKQNLLKIFSDNYESNNLDSWNQYFDENFSLMSYEEAIEFFETEIDWNEDFEDFTPFKDNFELIKVEVI